MQPINQQHWKLKGLTNIEVCTLQQNSSGPTIFCVHGIQGNKKSYQTFFENTKTADFQVIAIDLIGFGDSSKPEDFSYELKDQAQILLDLADLLNIKKFHIIGHSIGGMVATLALSLAADRILSIVSLEGNLRLEDGSETRRVAAMTFEEFCIKRYPFLKQKCLEVGDQFRYESLQKVPPEVFYKTSNSVVQLSNTNQLYEIFCNTPQPKLFVKGAKSHFMTRPSSSAITYIEIPNVDHLGLLPNDQVFQAAIDFIESLKC